MTLIVVLVLIGGAILFLGGEIRQHLNQVKRKKKKNE